MHITNCISLKSYLSQDDRKNEQNADGNELDDDREEGRCINICMP